MKHLAYLNKYFLKYRWRFLLGIVFVGLVNWFRVWQPQLISKAMDTVIAQVKHYKETGGIAAHPEAYSELGGQIAMYGAGVIGLALLMGLFMFFMRQTIIVMSRLIEYDMRKEIFGHYEKLDLAFYKRNSTGDMMSRISEDVNKVRMYLGPTILYGIDLVFLFILTISAMLNVSVTLTLWSLLPLPFLSISIYWVSRVINKKSEKIQQQLASLTGTAQEVYSGIRVVKSYAQEKAMGRWFAGQSEEYRKKSLSLIQVDAFFFPLMSLLIGASIIITVYVGGLQVVAGNITAGKILEFVIYINMLTWPVTAIGWIASLTQQAAASQKRINEFLQTKPAIDPTPGPSPGGEGNLTEIAFKDDGDSGAFAKEQKKAEPVYANTNGGFAENKDKNPIPPKVPANPGELPNHTPLPPGEGNLTEIAFKDDGDSGAFAKEQKKAEPVYANTNGDYTENKEKNPIPPKVPANPGELTNHTPLPPGEGPGVGLRGHIVFENVTFIYPDTGIKALEKVNFEVLPGQKFAIIGRTGSGKTTIADLLVRMYDVTEGRILIDGKDIREHDLYNLRRRIGYVPQDVFLFSDTVYGNIAFGKDGISREEAEFYAMCAAIHEEVVGLPKGYDTIVGERGVTLSGGQKQRISIARAFAKQPDVVVLDDCLSAVDTNTESRILGYLDNALADRTAIIITHRIYGMLQFDRIIVLDEHRISESGSHDELLATGGYYAELFEKQLAGEVTE